MKPKNYSLDLRHDLDQLLTKANQTQSGCEVVKQEEHENNSCC